MDPPLTLFMQVRGDATPESEQSQEFHTILQRVKDETKQIYNARDSTASEVVVCRTTWPGLDPVLGVRQRSALDTWDEAKNALPAGARTRGQTSMFMPAIPCSSQPIPGT